MSPPSPPIRFCTSRDGTRIAYAVRGHQGPALVKTLRLASHLETDADDPVIGGMLNVLAAGRRLVRYDARGFGLSDRDVRDVSLPRQLEDLQAVVEAAQLDRYALIGFAGGGMVAVHHAVREAERVSHLVLFGSCLAGRTARAQTAEAIAEAETLIRLAEIGWGKDDPAFRQLYTSQFIPQGTAEQFRSFNEVMRRAATPESAGRFLRVLHALDVRDAAPQVRCPTLVLHVRDDRRMPFEQGRALAAAIPGSRFVTLDSCNHALLPGEPALRHFAAELNAFLPSVPQTPTRAAAAFGGLTRREHNVLEQLARGLDNRAIGALIGMSEKTVRNNVSNILAKLDVHTRAAAIVKAREAGFGTGPVD